MKKVLKKLFLCVMAFCLFMQMNMVETQAATKVGNTKITSITQTGKKSVKVAFKKVSGAKGYTLQYRTAGGSWKTKNVTKNKLIISKLSTGKTYQFRMRAYKNVNGKKKYGKYYLHCERQCDGQAVEFAHKNAGGHVYLGCLHRN